MRREVHTRELQLMDAVRRKYMENQSKVKEVELKRMDDEIQRKVRALQIFRHIMYLYPFCGNSTPIPPTDLARGGGYTRIPTYSRYYTRSIYQYTYKSTILGYIRLLEYLIFGQRLF